VLRMCVSVCRNITHADLRAAQEQASQEHVLVSTSRWVVSFHTNWLVAGKALPILSVVESL
jgi:hypothetical protein